MPWLLNEDAALKAKLQGIKADSTNATTGGAPVAVRFRLPEVEMADVTFPLIVIEHRGVSRAPEREHRRGFGRLPYSPEGYDPLPDPEYPNKSNVFVNELPIPHNVDYMIRVFTRNARQMTVLTGRLMQEDKLHPRWGFLEVPQDGTIRRLEPIAGPLSRDGYDQDRKRLFQSIWIVRVSTELLPSEVWQFNNVVNKLIVDLSYYRDNYEVPLDHFEITEA